MKLPFPKIKIFSTPNFFLVAGPCAIESEEISFEIAETLISITEKLNIPFIYKGSFKKANRSRLDSFTGIGDLKALNILKKISDNFHIPVITDIHEPTDAAMAAEYVDVLQIPAFLARQTDLLVAAAKTKLPVCIKKGQFMSPESMKFAIEKCQESGNDSLFLVERGTFFGYQDLVVDFRSIPTMQKFAPVILDITHSLQQPNQVSGVTGGLPEMISCIAKAGIAAGVDGIFLETHPNPSEAKSDSANMLPLAQVEELLIKLTEIRKALT